jgi:hypothetical protein
MKHRAKISLAWSGIAVLLIAVSQVLIDAKRGRPFSDAAAGVLPWVLMWPLFFLLVLLMTSWRRLSAKSYEIVADFMARRSASGASAGERCPQCGFPNPRSAVHCVRCRRRLRQVEVIHVLETLPGARQSVPSLLYALAVLLSLGGGAVTLVLIGQERFLESEIVMIGGFLAGTAVSLVAFFLLIRIWVRLRARH